MPLTRRDFLKGFGVTVGTIGLSVTGYDHLIPYIHQPEDVTPGVATWYATSCRECPAGCGMLVRNMESRVVKCEGNPGQPVSVGKLCARGQAALQGLYDPDRVTHPLRRNRDGKLRRTNWDKALRDLGQQLTGKRVALVSDLQTGSLLSLMRAWLAGFGSDRLIIYEPIDYSSVRQAYGGVVPWFDIASCDFLISFGADFLETWISPIEFARAFVQMREISGGARAGFVYVGPRISATAVSADMRVLVRPGDEALVAKAIAADVSGGAPPAGLEKLGIPSDTISRIAAAFRSASAPLALPGGDAATARAAAALNAMKASPVHPNRPNALSSVSPANAMTALIDDMESGAVDAVVFASANPAYSLPDRKRFAEALKKAPVVVSLSSYMDETAVHAGWVLPADTPLESWGDYSPYPDVTNLMQPTMGRLYNTRHVGDILIGLASHTGTPSLGAANFYDYLRKRWGNALAPGATPDTVAPDWEALLQTGGKWSAPTARTAPAPAQRTSLSGTVCAKSATSDDRRLSLPLHAYPHIYLYDGRGANKRWLQEIPEPLTWGVWDTWVEMHPDTASQLGVHRDDQVRVSGEGHDIVLPVYVWRGVVPGAIAIPLGQGHSHYGRYAEGTGANVWPLLLRTPSPMLGVSSGEPRRWLHRRKGSTNQHDRRIVQTVSLSQAAQREEPVQMPLKTGYTKDDFYPGHDHDAHRWAMVVDMNKCIGCHACEAACYAENNLAITGADGAWRRREMTWLRIDRYMQWDQPQPVLFQPMLCQHCDAAPCEPVCPVFAASHSKEGLNMQVYNRCIGTRYCSNNCPYKVRRFNWFDFEWPEPLNWQLNPDVTVRSRGVMEKCTFCIQRIRRAEIAAKQEMRDLKDGEVVPACAQTCPTGVYTFGDLMDPSSRVAQIFASEPRAYQVLNSLKTKPGVLYLKRVLEG